MIYSFLMQSRIDKGILEGCTRKQKRIFLRDSRDCDVLPKVTDLPAMGGRFSFGQIGL